MRECLRSKLWWFAVAVAVARLVTAFVFDAHAIINKVLLVASTVLMIVVAVRFENHRRAATQTG